MLAKDKYATRDMKEEHLQLTFYTKFLPFVFSVGLFMLFLVAYLSIKGLKDDFDSSLPQPLHEVSILNDFQSQYMLETIDILQFDAKNINPYNTSFYQWNLYKSFMESLEQQKNGVFGFLRQLYQTTFLTQQYSAILAYKQTKKQLIAQIEHAIALEATGMLQTNKDALLQHARNVNKLCADIINTQVAIQVLEKETTDYFHNATTGLLCAITLLVFGVVICLDLIIIGFIRRLNQYLKNQFENATQDLRNLNAHLQNEIAKQVEDIRKKDIAIYAQSKLAAMGEMLQNIAHQWRNPLNALTLVIQDIQQRFHKNTLTQTKLDKHTKTALTLAGNMSATIENFCSFFRLETKFEYFDIQETIEHAKILNAPLSRSLNIQIHTDYKTKSKNRIFGNKHALTQIMLVLLGNAKDIFLERKVQNPHCFISVETKDSILHLQVYDNAGGIQEDIIDRIFDPYFTTKHKNIGTGIGLYMAREMLTKYLQGSIEARNITFEYEGNYYEGALFVLKLQLSNVEGDKNIHGRNTN